MKANYILTSVLTIFVLSCSEQPDLIKPSLAERAGAEESARIAADVGIGTTTHTSGSYTVKFKNEDSRLSPTVKDKLISYFFKVYPKEVARFNSKAPKSVTIIIDPDYTAAAAMAGGSQITVSAKYLRSSPDDIDLITHEAMHLVQAYPGGSSNPSWLWEGIADYAREKYGVTNTGWSLPEYESGQKYTDSYRVTASFLIWCEENVKGNIVDILDDKMRAGTYNTGTWEAITGSTVGELWSRYATSDRLLKGQTLVAGKYLRSPNGKYKLAMQSDGNLVLYKSGTTIAIWSSGTYGKPVTKCVMQADGNLVLYDKNNKAYWDTKTYMYSGGFFVVQNDGNLVVYQNGTARWHRW